MRPLLADDVCRVCFHGPHRVAACDFIDPPDINPHRYVCACTEYVDLEAESRIGVVVSRAERSRRGRLNRSRGNAYERSVAQRLGAKRVGQYGTATDVEAEWIALQCKNGGAFPERLWTWLQAIPTKDGQLRALVIGDAPGAGHKRREVIVLELDSFIDWYGKPEVPDAD